jgi:hypothetical protein
MSQIPSNARAVVVGSLHRLRPDGFERVAT